MRYVVLDTETTGLDAKQGHRVIEIGCVEMVGRGLTGRHFHTYINPDRAVDEGALAVHGLSDDFLADKPRFADISDDFLSFIEGAQLIIHNAAFDVGFLDAELARLKKGRTSDFISGVTDSLLMAREQFPGKRNNLDALCDRLGVNNAHRTFHGALLDAQILAEVFLAMTRGQDSLVIEEAGGPSEGGVDSVSLEGLKLSVLRAGQEDIGAHEAYLDGLDKEVKGSCVWRNLTAPQALEQAPVQAS